MEDQKKPRYRAPTIKERGGLEVHLKNLGVDYKLFKLLRGLDGQTHSSIAKSLSKGRKIALKPNTIAHWARVDDAEMKESQNAEG